MLAVAYLAAGIAIWAEQRHFIFFPSEKIELTPDAFGLKYEELFIPVRDGTQSGRLFAWWIPADDPNAKVILYLHGNGANVWANAEHAGRFHKMGYSVLLPDYRGYGRSSGGFPSEHTVYADAEAVWQYLVRDRHLDPKRVVIYGHSLGGAIAVELAIRHPEAAGLITESTFTSVYEIAESQGLFRIFPLRLLLNQRFDSIHKVPGLKLPYLVLHGTGDRLIPYHMSEQIYGAAPQPKRLVLIPGGGHDTSAVAGGRLYSSAVRDFVGD